MGSEQQVFNFDKNGLMHFRNNPLLIRCILLIMFFNSLSCAKDRSSPELGISGTDLILTKEVYLGGEDTLWTREYNYDAFQKLDEPDIIYDQVRNMIQSAWVGRAFDVTFTYDNMDRIKSIKTKGTGDTFEFMYDNNHVEKIIFYRDFEIEENPKILAEYQIFYGQNTMEVEYFNMKNELVTHSIFEFDEAINPYSSEIKLKYHWWPIEPEILFSDNNVIKKTILNFGLGSKKVINYTYEYNQDLLPVKMEMDGHYRILFFYR